MNRVLALFRSAIAEIWKEATAYRPERHYMRGPGPKWRAKHASALPAADTLIDERKSAFSSR